MIKTPIGARVGAILSSNATEVHLLGFGVYDGNHTPPFGPMGAPWSVVEEMKKAGQLPQDWTWTNPRITLDDGRVVWGCQCWWGPEDAVRKRIAGLRVVPATLDKPAPDATPDQPAAAGAPE